MKLVVIDRAIRSVCNEVEKSDHELPKWQTLTEDQLLHQACVCMFSSQMVFEVADAAAMHLKECGLLTASHHMIVGNTYERRLRTALSEPLSVEWNGKVRQMRPRFRNRFAMFLAKTMRTMRKRGQFLREILRQSESAREAREVLIWQITGFGPKQASLFLRRVGYSSQLAILDTHILDYLKFSRGIDPKPSSLARLKSYELIEEEFRSVAIEIGHSVGCVDLATWVTMRVAKREGIW